MLFLLQVNKKLEEVLTSKNSIIRALQYDVAKVSYPTWALAPPPQLAPSNNGLQASSIVLQYSMLAAQTS